MLDADRLAAIWTEAEMHVHRGDANYDAFTSTDVLAIRDHIDALQAENERLLHDNERRHERLQYDLHCATLRADEMEEHRDALQARVTLLEGLLRDAKRFVSLTHGVDVLERIDAALSHTP